jgi:hypothetical protein
LRGKRGNSELRRDGREGKERDTKDLKDMETGRMVPESKLLFGSLGGTGIEGALEARLLFGVAPSDHEMLFVIIR